MMIIPGGSSLVALSSHAPAFKQDKPWGDTKVGKPEQSCCLNREEGTSSCQFNRVKQRENLWLIVSDRVTGNNEA